MSGITVRDQVKPSVLAIHKFTPRAIAGPISRGSSEIIREESSSGQEINADATTRKSDPVEMETGHSRCSFLRASGFCRFMSAINVSKEMFHSSSAEQTRSMSTISLKSEDTIFFCEWYPVMFGLDEDYVPSSEHVLYGEDMDLEEMFDFEKDEEGKAPGRRLRYGRRARENPVLTAPDGREYTCMCNIDLGFVRHYVPHFGGAVESEKESWRTPHFSSFWEDYNEQKVAAEYADVLAELEAGLIKPEIEKIPYKRPKSVFIGKRMKDFRRHLLQSLRPLTCRELRRYRMPYVEAILLELQEDGFLETAKFFKDLLIEEYQLDQNREPCPVLRKSRSKVQKLVKLLSVVEKKGRKQEYSKQSYILLKTGRHFNDNVPTWWWLANRLYQKAVDVSSQCKIDGGKSEAIARYIYGMFLLDFVRDIHGAQEHLMKVRELTMGRDWNASSILPNSREPIYKECCNLLCRALIEISKRLRLDGKPEAALQYIHKSYKLCEESHTSRQDIELETFFELGITYQATGQLEWAKAAFKKFIALAKLENHTKRVCDGHLELAVCYRMEGNMNSCHMHLRSYYEYANAKNEENLKAFANRYLGEFLLDNGYSEEAVTYFESSFDSFLKQYQEAVNTPFSEWRPESFTLPQDVELVRVLTGLARGEILTKPLCRLILRTRDARNQTDTLKLLKWKNSQEICFDLNLEDESPDFLQHLISEPEAAQATQSESATTSEGTSSQSSSALENGSLDD